MDRIGRYIGPKAERSGWRHLSFGRSSRLPRSFHVQVQERPYSVLGEFVQLQQHTDLQWLRFHKRHDNSKSGE